MQPYPMPERTPPDVPPTATAVEERDPEKFAGEPVPDPWDEEGESDGGVDSGPVSGQPA